MEKEGESTSSSEEEEEEEGVPLDSDLEQVTGRNLATHSVQGSMHPLILSTLTTGKTTACYLLVECPLT